MKKKEDSFTELVRCVQTNTLIYMCILRKVHIWFKFFIG